MSVPADEMRRARHRPAAASGLLPLASALVMGIALGAPVLGLARGGPRTTALPSVPSAGGPSDEWLVGWSAARRTIPEIQGEALHLLFTVLLALAMSLVALSLIVALTLVLARGTSRRPELALRAALGGGRARLLRRLGREGAPLLAGVLVASAALGTAVTIGLRRSWPQPGWGAWSPSVDVAGTALAAGLVILIPLLAWLAPARVAAHRDLRRHLVVGSRATASPAETLARSTVAVVQLAASLLLLTGAGVLLRGFASGPPSAGIGVAADHTLVARLQLPDGALTPQERAAFFGSVRARLAVLPGVIDTSIVTPGTWARLGERDATHALTGNPEQPGWMRPASYHAVGPGTFAAMGLALRHGREFTPGDAWGAAPVAIVNQAFVTHFRLAGTGVGRSLQLHGASLDAPFHTIVGVVDDWPAEAPGTSGEPVPAIYLSALQHPPTAVTLAVRSEADPLALLPSVEAAVASLVPAAVLDEAETLTLHLARLRSPLRWFAALFGILALAALLLAAIGVHALMRANVQRRTREIGIRMALGARPGDVTRLILAQSLRIIALGTMIGSIGALSLARLLQLRLAGVEAFDPLLFAGVVALLSAVGLLASHRPARQAAGVHPQTALRIE